MTHTNVIAEALLAHPSPIVIWVFLILLTIPATLMLNNPHRWHNPRRVLREVSADLRARAAAGRARQSEAVEAARYADEIQICTRRAEAAAAHWHERLEQAGQEQLTAWQAWLDAETRLRAGLAAGAYGTPWSVQTCEQYADRERFLHRTVAAAARRGDLPAAAVADALAGRNGWDARLHPLDQELVVNRAAARYRRHRYDLAAAAEKAAWHDTDLADRAAGSLRGAHTAALHRSAELRHLLPRQHRSSITAARPELSPAP